MNRSFSLTVGCILVVSLLAARASAQNMVVQQIGSRAELSLQGGQPFHTTEAQVTGARLIAVSGSTLLIALWNERAGAGQIVPHYAVSLDGVGFFPARSTSYVIELRGGGFDPLTAVPAVAESLRADGSAAVFVVQFVAPPLEAFRQAIRQLGGTVRGFLPNNAHIVEMSETTRLEVESLAYVRWVGPFHAAYRLERFLRDNLDPAGEPLPLQRYNIAVFERGPGQKATVAQRIVEWGGTVDMLTPNGFLLQATLTREQLLSLVHLSEVAFVDRWSPAEPDMDIARQISGANFVEQVAGYTGEGVTAEVMDGNLMPTHDAFKGLCVGTADLCTTDADCNGGTCEGAPILHGPQDGTSDHGTKVYGSVFGDGTGAPVASFGVQKGMIPDAQGIFGDSTLLTDRHRHTCQLLDDPACCDMGDDNCPYRAVFQTNSWGTGRNIDYTSISADLDDVLFENDILVCQSQSNCGNPAATPGCCCYPNCGDDPRCSRPQAWAKNVVSVGGVRHGDNLDKANDRWKLPGLGSASTGLALDGRIKPDLTHFYDFVVTTQFRCDEASPDRGKKCSSDDECDFGTGAACVGIYTDPSGFGGTSAATPIACGGFGLFFQMWAEGIFGNVLADPACDPLSQPCVFINRPHMATAKAMIINTAEPYCFNDPDKCLLSDLLRERQGWGLPSPGKLHALRGNFLFILDEDETQLLTPGQVRGYPVSLGAGRAALKVTLVYADPMGQPFSQVHRVNDLSLRVVSPSGAVYWGNHGLMEGNWSTATPAGQPDDNDTINTVENVFIADPEEGDWVVEVRGDEIVEDGHTETAGVLDADFALVVSEDFDCNGNGIVDSEDVSIEMSEDCDSNGVPDECQLANNDCNGNGLPDQCDFSLDCNQNTFFDACDIINGVSDDCNSNAVPDECDIALGTSLDANVNGIPDRCEVPKNRYLTFAPELAAGDVAYKIEMTAGSDPLFDPWDAWVAFPDANHVSFVVCAQPQPRDDWPVAVHVGDSEIVPDATYEISSYDGMGFGTPIELTTHVLWGDVVGQNIDGVWAPPQGVVNINDAFAAILRFQVKPNAPPLMWVDVEPEEINHVVNINDVLKIILAFKGAAYPFSQPAVCVGRSGPPVIGDPATFTLVAASPFIEAGEGVDIEVFIDTLPDLGGYQVTLEVSGGTNGKLVLTGVTVDSTRPDYVFNGQSGTLPTPDVPRGRVGNALTGAQSGVPVSGPGYLATFSYIPSESAFGDFHVAVVVGHDDTSPMDSSATRLAYNGGSCTVIGVGIDCHVDPDCDDANDCTIDTCVNDACTFSNAASGAACDDGLFCTTTSECDGAGTCVGSGSPCPTRSPVCCELADTCVAVGVSCPAPT